MMVRITPIAPDTPRNYQYFKKVILPKYGRYFYGDAQDQSTSTFVQQLKTQWGPEWQQYQREQAKKEAQWWKGFITGTGIGILSTVTGGLASAAASSLGAGNIISTLFGLGASTATSMAANELIVDHSHSAAFKSGAFAGEIASIPAQFAAGTAAASAFAPKVVKTATLAYLTDDGWQTQDIVRSISRKLAKSYEQLQELSKMFGGEEQQARSILQVERLGEIGGRTIKKVTRIYMQEPDWTPEITSQQITLGDQDHIAPQSSVYKIIRDVRKVKIDFSRVPKVSNLKQLQMLFPDNSLPDWMFEFGCGFTPSALKKVARAAKTLLLEAPKEQPEEDIPVIRSVEDLVKYFGSKSEEAVRAPAPEISTPEKDAAESVAEVTSNKQALVLEKPEAQTPQVEIEIPKIESVPVRTATITVPFLRLSSRAVNHHKAVLKQVLKQVQQPLTRINIALPSVEKQSTHVATISTQILNMVQHERTGTPSMNSLFTAPFSLSKIFTGLRTPQVNPTALRSATRTDTPLKMREEQTLRSKKEEKLFDFLPKPKLLMPRFTLVLPPFLPGGASGPVLPRLRMPIVWKTVSFSVWNFPYYTSAGLIG